MEAASPPREKHRDTPGGARELFAWVITRNVSSSFVLPKKRILRTAAAKSVEPIPRRILVAACALLRYPIRRMAQWFF